MKDDKEETMVNTRPTWRTDALGPRLAGYLSEAMGQPVSVENLKRFTAGLSWVTVSFDLIPSEGDRQKTILRIGDPNGLLAPYSSKPEALALAVVSRQTDVPLPHVLWSSDDASILGAPFLIVRHLTGETLLPRWPGTQAQPPYPHARAIAIDFADHLSAIHGCTWQGTEAKALSPGVTGDTCTLREIDRWVAHAAGPDGALEDTSMLFAAGWLRAHAEPAKDVVLLHGDYRVGNFMVDQGRISGLLDWELTHLGDPHEDIAWATMRTFGGTDTMISGLLDRQVFIDRYQERTGRTVDERRLRYFHVLAQFKMAAMLVGAEHRLRAGNVHDVRLAVMTLQKSTTLTGLLKMIEVAA